MAQVVQVQRRQDGPKQDGGLLGTGISTRDALTAAGLAAGAYLAIPTGGASLAAMPAIIGGAGGGAALGGTVGGLVDKPKAQGGGGGPMASAIPQQGQSSAITRRLEQISADNGSRSNLDTLMAAEQASAKLPEQERQAYQPVLTKARMLEEQRLRDYYG